MYERPISARPRMSRRFTLITALLASATAFAGAAPAQAADCTSVAALDGADTNPGTELAPFRTVEKMIASLLPGDTGCLRGGIYTELDDGYAADFGRSGTAAAPITLRSFPGERAQLVGTVLVRKGADNIHLSHLNLEGTGNANGIKIYAADTVIEDSEITNRHRSNSCIILGSPSAGTAIRPVIQRNVIHGCGNPDNGNKDHGIYASSVSRGRIAENVIADHSAYAIQLYPGANETVVANNVIDGAGSIRGGVVFGGSTVSVSNDNVVERNVVVNAATFAVGGSWGGTEKGTGNVARRNCHANTEWGIDPNNEGGFVAEDNVEAEPEFLDPEHLDYRLSPTSPCLAVVGYDTAATVREEQEAAGTPPADSGEIDASAFFASGGEPKLGGFPTVRIKKPRRNGRRLTVAARATDAAGVARVLFLVDDEPVATDRRPPFRAALRRVRRSAKVLTARAYNLDGRAASASIRLRRR